MPIIDQIPSVPGLFVMLGESGTSFKTSPAIGRCLAEWIVKGQPEAANLTPFRSTRFAEGRPWVDSTELRDRAAHHLPLTDQLRPPLRGSLPGA